ncbi:MAG: hypothetical protein R3F37_08785 [Candidatus Competibacteraceae bacterium]
MWDKAEPLNPLRTRRRRRLGVHLALLALLLQLLVPFSQAIPAPWQAQTGMLLVCTGFGGLKTLPWPSEEPQHPPRHFQCPICHLQASCGAGLIPPIASGPAFAVNPLFSTVPDPGRILLPNLWRSPAQPRAPPVFC